MSGLRNVVSMFDASLITSLGLALRTSRAINIMLAYSWTERTARQLTLFVPNIVRPLTQLRQLALPLY